jgi:hypothetical protein
MKADPLNELDLNLPANGWSREKILDHLRGLAAADPDYAGGRTWSLVYYLGVERLARTAPALVLWVGVVIFGSMTLHLLLAALFRIDTDTVIITSVAAICSPPFVPLVAGALHNREIIVGGLTSGIIGYALGNYLGITCALVLKTVF